MEKQKKKVWCYFLVFALIIGIVGTTGTIVSYGASKITLKSGKAAPSTIYAGKSYSLKVAGTAVKFYSSNKSVATIGVTTGKLTAKATGTVKITARSKKNGKVVATKQFTVNQRATSISADASEVNMEINGTYTLKATKTPKTSTDVVKFVSDNKAVATVGYTSGKITARSNGTANITIYSMATKATKFSSSANKTVTVKIIVGGQLQSATQTKSNVVRLEFKGLAENHVLTGSNLVVTRDETGVVIVPQSVTYLEKNTYEVTLCEELKDGKTYTVSYDDSKAQFTATDGKVATLKFTPESVIVSKATPLYVQAIDTNGIVVQEYKFKCDYDTKISYLTNTVAGGSINDGEVLFDSLDGKAVVSATYKDDTITDENGKVFEITTGDVTIMATIAEVDITKLLYTIDSVEPLSWNFIEIKNKVYEGQKTNFYTNLQELNGDYSDYTFESSDPDVVKIDKVSDVLQIEGVKVGAAYIIMKNRKQEAVRTFPVTVSSAPKASTINLGQSSVILSNSEYIQESTKVSYSLMDQYGNKIKAQSASITCEKMPQNANSNIKYEIDMEGQNLLFTATNASAGTYQFKIIMDGVSKSCIVIVKQPDESASSGYSIKASRSQVNTAYLSEAEDVDQVIEFALMETKQGVEYRYVNVSKDKVRIKDSEGKTIDLGDMLYEKDGKIYVVARKLDENNIIKKMVAGNYSVSLGYINNTGSDVEYTTSIAITDTQQGLCPVRMTVNIEDASDISQVVADCFGFIQSGKAFRVTKDMISDVKYVQNGEDYYFESVVVNMNIGGHKLPIKVYLGYTISVHKVVYADGTVSITDVSGSGDPGYDRMPQ